MAEPTPIRQGVRPQLDPEHELVDYLTAKVSQFTRETGVPAESVAIVLLGKNSAGDPMTMTHSWSPLEGRTRFETCSMAAALLTKRAIMDGF